VRATPARRIRVSESRSVPARRAAEFWRTHKRCLALLRQSTSLLRVCSGRLESQTTIHSESRIELRLPGGSVHGPPADAQLDSGRSRRAYFWRTKGAEEKFCAAIRSCVRA